MSIMLELCRRNSIGNQYHDPTVVEVITVDTEDEAREILTRPMVNEFFYRRVEEVTP